MTIQFLKTAVFPQGMAPSDENDALRVVEACGRTAYKSEDKITEDSARSFVLMLKKHGHLSVLEHSNIVLGVSVDGAGGKTSAGGELENFERSLRESLKDRNAFHRISSAGEFAADGFAVAGNFRSWIETLEYLKGKNDSYYGFFAHHLRRHYPNLFDVEGPVGEVSQYRVSLLSAREQLEALKSNPRTDLPVFIFKLICDRGITHEVVRHRVLSFTQESTRYVNYKNRGMTLILPEELYPFYDLENGKFKTNDPLVETWMQRAQMFFGWYQEDVARGLRPEIARDILPNLLKSEIFVSGRWSGWKHFIKLRDSRQAHPRIRFIAREVRKYFESLGLSPAD